MPAIKRMYGYTSGAASHVSRDERSASATGDLSQGLTGTLFLFLRRV
ncbi:hypothetical protein OBA47_02005 [bacterium]|nr:hypothetical protein [bacterium]